MKKSKLISYRLAVVVSLLLIFFRLHSVNAQTLTLKIIETSDVHGAIYPYDFINDKPAATSLAQVLTYVNQERQNKNQDVLLLDAGDIIQGQPVVYYYNFERPEVPHLYARVMNHMGYHAGAVGNHDIETGHPVYDRFTEELNFPWLAANAVKTLDGEPYFQPYTILERRGVRIAILGMVTPGIPNWLPPRIWAGMAFEDMVECARKWVPIIRDKEQPDLLLGLFHSGVDYTYGGLTANTPRNENGSQLVAEQVPGFDIVFVGHDHQGWNFFIENSNGKKIPILGAQSDARTVAIANVKMKYDTVAKSWQKAIEGQIVDISGFEPDERFIQKFSAEFEEVKQYVSRSIGAFTETVTTRDAMFGNSAFVDIIHQIQLDLTGADLSITAPLAFDASIKKGTIHVRDMFNLYKYENLLYTMNLTGEEVKNFLEYSYGLWFNHMKSANDHLLNFQFDNNGELVKSNRSKSYHLKARTYNFDSMAGINYTVDVSKPAGQRVTIRSLADGSRFDLNKTHTVAINSYRGNGGGGHLTVGAQIPKERLSDRIVTSTEKDLRYFLMKWIEKNEVVTPKRLSNWQVIPAAWWQAAKERDFELLYGKTKTTE